MAVSIENHKKCMKYNVDLTVKSVKKINEKFVLLKLTQEAPLPPMCPGQFRIHQIRFYVVRFRLMMWTRKKMNCIC